MNISSVSSASYSSSSASSSSSAIAELKKQIAALQKKIQQENASKDDAATKLQKTQQYQAQITALQTQLQVLQAK